jgi:hypothetical protein
MRFYLSHSTTGELTEVPNVFKRETAESFLREHGIDAVLVEVPHPCPVEVSGDVDEIGLVVTATQSVLVAYERKSKEAQEYLARTASVSNFPLALEDEELALQEAT